VGIFIMWNGDLKGLISIIWWMLPRCLPSDFFFFWWKNIKFKNEYGIIRLVYGLIKIK
jgi:hypothetical protein